MGGSTLAEADEIEAAERTADPNAPLPPHVKVSQPGRARSKVLQVRLNPDELAALEAIADRRALPVSTVAREQLLKLLRQEPTTPRAVSSILQQLLDEVTILRERLVEGSHC